MRLATLPSGPGSGHRKHTCTTTPVTSSRPWPSLARRNSRAGRTTCVGVPLAAALEARALGVLGAARDARAALDRAEVAVSNLEPEALVPSAFGYNEAQLRFHEGNTLTHLRDTRAAWTAQDQALALYPERDYLDRSLVELDRATCLAHDGDVACALGPPPRPSSVSQMTSEAVSSCRVHARSWMACQGSTRPSRRPAS